MSRKLHDGVDFSAKWIRLQKVGGMELPCERRHLLTHSLNIGPEKLSRNLQVPLRENKVWDGWEKNIRRVVLRILIFGEAEG